MPARLHIGTDVFDLPEQPPALELVENLMEAFTNQAPISVNVTFDGGVVVLILNPANLKYVAVDLEGKWIGFHSG
jgi:hypothetical protein